MIIETKKVSTKEIADRFDKVHGKVMRDVRTRIEEGVIDKDWIEKSIYESPHTGVEPMYLLNFRAANEMVGSYTGLKHRLTRKEFMTEILKRFQV